MEALSPTMEEGQLVRWLKAEGDSIANGDIIAEIETDKATMELVARGEGILRKVLLGEGGTAPVGEVIAVIAGADEEIGELVGAAGDSPEPVADSPVSADGPKSARGPTTPGSPVASAPAEDPPTATVGEAAQVGAESEEAGLPDQGGERLKASPLARRLAEENGVDLRTVPGSGPGGRIVVRDVEAAKVGAGAAVPPATVGTTEAQPWHPGVPSEPGVDFEDLPLSQMRKTIAKRLVESLSPVPHFFLRITVDMTRTLAARKRVNALLEAQGDKVSINDFVLKSVAGALGRHPEANAQWMGDAVRRHYRVHLGVAVAVEDGLITPVIRDANQKGLAQISREIRELAGRGREKKLQPEEYTGSTFSVSNLGMFGIHEFTGVINPPEASILAVGAIEETPVAEDGQVVVRPLMKVTMSCDHRVIDGATGARFLQTLKEMLEEPAAILV